MIKAVFFDLDGTLLASDGKVAASTVAAIKLLKESGIVCGIATGRSPFSARKLVQGINVDVFVSYNGQYIFSNDQVLHGQALSKEVLETLVDYGNQQQKKIIFGGAHSFVGQTQKFEGAWAIHLKNKLPQKVQEALVAYYHRPSFFKLKKEKYQLETVMSEPVYQCMLHASEKETKHLESKFDEWSFTRSNPFSVDIISKGTSKLQGIERVIEPMKIKKTEVMAFGDSLNDLEMLQGVGLGVAMGNALPEIKKIAASVTHSNDQDGIYHAICQMLETRSKDGRI